MKKMGRISIAGLIIIVVGLSIFFYLRYRAQRNMESSISPALPVIIDYGGLVAPTEPTTANEPETRVPTLANPTPEFQSRVTKKSFGTYVTPRNSPVQPERFSGYHAAVDIEYGDTTDAIPVFAIADGEIVSRDWVDGYGGLLVMKITINSEPLYVIYGHLNTASFNQQQFVYKGDQLGVLAYAYSTDTDGERKHLHLAIRLGTLDIRGYVQSPGDLVGWYDPLSFYQTINQ